MKMIKLLYQDGVYSAPIDISVEEWKEMLQNEAIFDSASIEMVVAWYNQPFHQATSKEVMRSKGIKGRTPYNGIVKGLGIRIVKYLNRFEVQQNNGTGKSYSIIPFEGWHVDYDVNKSFVWKLRDELIVALEELRLVNPESEFIVEDDNFSYSSTKEGKRVMYYSSRYERSTKNRNAAIKIHGTSCMVCGFDFERTYGLLGKDYIEVHHIRPLCDQQDEVEVDPEKDLICVCANCHRMLHRTKHDILAPEKLKEIVANTKKDKALKNIDC